MRGEFRRRLRRGLRWRFRRRGVDCSGAGEGHPSTESSSEGTSFKATWASLRRPSAFNAAVADYPLLVRGGSEQRDAASWVGIARERKRGLRAGRGGVVHGVQRLPGGDAVAAEGRELKALLDDEGDHFVAVAHRVFRLLGDRLAVLRSRVRSS